MSEEEYFHPLSRRPRYELPNTLQSFGWFGVWLVTGVILLGPADLPLIGTIAVVVGISGALRYNNGVGWRIVWRRVKDLITRRKNGDIIGRKFEDTAFALDGLKHRTTGYAPPLTLEPLPWRDQRGRVAQLGIIHDAETGYDTIILGVDGWSSANNADPVERMYHDARWVQALKRAANETGTLPRLSVFTMRRPASTEPVESYLERRVNTGIDDAIKDNLREAITETYQSAVDFYTGFAISVPRPRSWKRPLSELDDQVIRQAPLMRIFAALDSALTSAGMDRVRAVSYFDTNTVLRAAFDVVDLPQFMLDVADDKRLDREQRISSLEEAGTLRRGPWPETIRATHDGLLADRTWHATFWTSSFDYDRVPVGTFDELFSAMPGWYTIALWLEIRPQERSRRASNTKRKILAIHDRTRPARTIQQPEEVIQRSMAEEEAWSLFRSHSNTVRYRFLVTVTASSKSELDDRANDVVDMFRNHGVRLTQYLGENQQLPALLAPFGITL